MKKVALVFFVALLALVALPSGASRAADTTMTVKLVAQNGSGQDGTATITQVGTNDVKVTIQLANGTTTAQPAHIHQGTCATLNPTPKYPLTNVVNGASDTTVMVSMSELAKGGYAINVHKSAAEISTYVSCGDIQAMSMAGGTTTGGNMTGGTTGGSTMPATGNGGQPLFLAGLAVLALALTGAGMRLARNRA